MTVQEIINQLKNIKGSYLNEEITTEDLIEGIEARVVEFAVLGREFFALRHGSLSAISKSKKGSREVVVVVLKTVECDRSATPVHVGKI